MCWAGSRTIRHQAVVMSGEIGGNDEEKAADSSNHEQAGGWLYRRQNRTAGKRMATPALSYRAPAARRRPKSKHSKRRCARCRTASQVPQFVREMLGLA
jgi:hypothetical protein